MGIQAGKALIDFAGRGVNPSLWIVDRIAKVQVSATRDVVVLDVVQVDAARAVVADLNHRVGGKLLVDRCRPELGLRGADVLIDVAKTARRDGLGPARAGEGAEVVIGNGRGLDHDDRIVGRVLNDVERNVAEVAFVRDAIAGTEGGLAIAENVVGKADAR